MMDIIMGDFMMTYYEGVSIMDNIKSEIIVMGIL